MEIDLQDERGEIISLIYIYIITNYWFIMIQWNKKKNINNQNIWKIDTISSKVLRGHLSVIWELEKLWYVRENKIILYPPPKSAPITKNRIEGIHHPNIERIPKTSLINVEAGGPPIIPTQLRNHNKEKNEDQIREFWFSSTLRVVDRRYRI